MYTGFAKIYDKLMCDIDYTCWADYIESIFYANGINPHLILELGCGTGSFCIEMSKRGYDMTGIDISAEMLSCARQKCENEGLDSILLINQDMTDFELYGTVDAVVCLLDSLNYIVLKRDLKKTFKLVRNYLNPGGLFIFDINSCYKLEKILGNNVFYSVEEDVSYIWQNRYDKRKKTCEFDLTFFVKQGGRYERHDECHTERAFSVKEIKSVISNSGMDLLGVYDGLSFRKPAQKSERIFFVCRK